MSAIKDGRAVIMLDKERHALFSLNVMDEMQGKFGGFDKLSEIVRGPDMVKNVRWLLTRLLNEGADEGEPELTEKQVGKLVHAGNLNYIIESIFKAFNVGTAGNETPTEAEDEPEPDDEDAEETEKNAMGGRD